ncbi:MAG: hypothetical protein QN155_03055 [Armatimonadota bacterium]|nr:hypothetical protein [Armatimonadota bacterium]MDR7403047.1 hypothetical protein [Armatimonadota bacterium]
MRAAVVAVLIGVVLLGLVPAAGAARPENPTARAEQGSFNKSPAGLDHQAPAAWEHDGPARPHVEWE